MQDHDADNFLVSAIRKGDQRAWHQLIDRYQGRLLAFARSRLGQVGDAEDVLQETLLGFVNSLPHFDAARSLETYLFAIMRYKIGEVLARKRRRPEYVAGFDIDDEAGAVPEPSDGETPSRVAAGHELTERQEEVLSHILRQLIEEFRDRGKLEDLRVIELLFYVGLRNKEAADLLNRDEKAVAGVKFRAIARLREFLEAMDEQERGPHGDQQLSSEATIARVWRQRRLTCLKRGTIGSYLLGVLDEPWASYTAFHLDAVRCLMCMANVQDLQAENQQADDGGLVDRVFESSVGFLSRPGAGA